MFWLFLSAVFVGCLSMFNSWSYILIFGKESIVMSFESKCLIFVFPIFFFGVWTFECFQISVHVLCSWIFFWHIHILLKLERLVIFPQTVNITPDGRWKLEDILLVPCWATRVKSSLLVMDPEVVFPKEIWCSFGKLLFPKPTQRSRELFIFMNMWLFQKCCKIRSATALSLSNLPWGSWSSEFVFGLHQVNSKIYSHFYLHDNFDAVAMSSPSKKFIYPPWK